MQSRSTASIKPTVWLAATTLVALYASMTAFVVRVLPLGAAAPLIGVALYATYSVAHDNVPETARLLAASKALALHPPSRTEMQDSVARWLRGEVLALCRSLHSRTAAREGSA